MKKFLLTASMLIMGIVATFAQDWAVGDEITGKIGNPSFTDASIAPWTFAHSGGNTTETGGLCELYNGSDADLYQFIELPAGMYKLECQGYYRIGQSWDVDPNTYGTDDWVDEASLYVQNGKYNVDSKQFTGARTFKTPLMPRLFDYQATKIYDMNEAGDESSWDMTDGDYGEKGWGPTSVPGSLKWFAAGKYQPYDEDGVKYNTVTFFLTEDGYVKIGVTKAAARNADSFMVTNFKLYYAGQAGEAAELMALQEDVDDYCAKIEALIDNSNGLLKGKLEDEYLQYTWAYGSSSSMDKETATEAKEVLATMLGNAQQAQSDVATMKTAISAIEALAASTDYAGKEVLTAALEAAEASIAEDYVYEGTEEWNTYQVLAENLYKARLDYLIASPKGEDGSWNFTAFINFPWFCNPEFEPTWDEETGFWKANQAALDAGWRDWDDVDGTGKGKDVVYNDDGETVKQSAATPIADMVKISGDKETPGQWYQVNNGLVVYWNDNLTCVKKWDTPHTDDGVREVAQKVTGIPNGFYKLKALGQTWTNDWDQGEKLCKCRIYLQSGDMISESPYLELGGWWGKDINQWKELETDFVEVTNNELIVAGHDNGFIAWTGFRLFYYGETPDFDALLKPALDQAKTDVNSLWAGDQKIVNEMLAKVPATITDKETYLESQAIVNEANAYINTAKTAVGNWKGIDNFSTLASKYEESSAENSFINTALMETLNVGEEENSVYTDAIANDNQYKAYVSYLDYRESLGDYIKDALVAPVVEEQNAYLTATFATPEKLDEFKLALGVPYNKAKFAAEGIDKATLTNPVEATFLLINPSFSEGTSKGWTTTGTGAATDNEYAYDEKGYKTNAELWNRENFTFSQTVNGLPAGTYELRVRALYRNGGGVSNDGRKKYEDAEDKEQYPDANAVLFAKSGDNEWRSTVKSIYSLYATENSFTQCGTAWETDELDGSKYVTAIHYMNGTIDESEQKEGVTYSGHDEGSYPLDSRIATGEIDEEELEELVYYYPASMQGFYAACKKDANAYANSLTFYLSEEGNVEVGIRKLATIGGDWVIMDDWQLFYLGKEAPTAIDEVAEGAAIEGAVEYYTVNGVQISAPQKGFNIVKYANGETKKVYIQ